MKFNKMEIKWGRNFPLAYWSSPKPSKGMASELLKSKDLESWIEILSECRQLPEEDIKLLCDKVQRTSLPIVLINL